MTTRKVCAGLLASLLCGSALFADQEDKPDFASKVAAMERHSGLATFYSDVETNQIWLELPAGNGEIGQYLYVEGLTSGLGSNPVGLDRGQLGNAQVISLRRAGNRLLIEQPNLAYRALTENTAEATATRESFARSVLWAGPIEPIAADGRALADITSFLVRDAHQIPAQLTATNQGTFELDPERSLVDLGACHAFPDNLEFEAILTYGGSGEIGPHVWSTAPVATALTFVQHHSLIRLPDSDYQPRRFDPRGGSFAIDFYDYAAPLEAPVLQQWIVRHRLGRGEPLVYYVDRGIPEPVRSAVIEGAKWWADAYDAAGFPGSFQVALLPEDAHPLDVRYNVIEWVHRSTRGWSYGGGIIDPRTGEMLKGHVNLGSLRVRQDRLIFEGLIGADGSGKGGANDPVELALARIRQLSAHEVGHTLGITHNFAASTYGRESVMDYPAPLVTVDENGDLDVSKAYDVGIGDWDKHAIEFAYAEVEGDEQAGLEAILAKGRDAGLVFVTDSDARPAGASNAVGSLWDNGRDAVSHLEIEMNVRRVALANFGADRVAPGAPLALLEEVLATVYFHHRYQLEAALKVVGGMEYGYALRGDGQEPWTAVAGERQRRALSVILDTLDPAVLDIPPNVLATIPPRPFGYGRNRELLEHGTSPAFDSLGAVETAAAMVVRGLLQHERAARMVDFRRRDATLPGFKEVVEGLVARSFDGVPTGRLTEVARTTQGVVVRELAALAGNPEASTGVRARAEAGLSQVLERLSSVKDAHSSALVREIERALARPGLPMDVPPGARPAPPGSPIGSGDLESYCSRSPR